MKVDLLQASDLRIVVDTVRICYQSKGDNMGEKDKKLIHNIIKSGHESVIEPIVYSFEIKGISVVCSHQLVRARIASYSQKSLRHTKPKDFVMPPIDNEVANNILNDLYETMGDMYTVLVEDLKLPKQVARYVLPQATQTELIMTINARSLRNFFNLRLHPSADWEIRTLAENMFLKLPQAHREWLFFDIQDKYFKED
jgi:thymidylate synthase (FAD)